MDDQGQNDPLFPIAVLIDELKVNSLPTASLVLVSERVTVTSTTMFFSVSTRYIACQP